MTLSPPRRSAALLFAGVLIIGWCMQSRQSAWIMMTVPTEPASAMNPVTGYTARSSAGLDHLENVSTFRQIALFSGALVYPDMYFLRPVHAWIASLAAPVVGARNALRVLNLVWWWLAAIIAWSAVALLGGDRWAAMIAAALVLGGSGWLFHVADYSAHSLSFLVYYAGIVALLALVGRERLSFRDQLRIGVLLGLAALVYNTSLYLLVAYVIIAFRRGKLQHLALASVIALAIPALWDWILVLAMYAGSGTPGDARLLDFYAQYSPRSTERVFLARSVEAWQQHASSVSTLASALSRHVVEHAGTDSPVVLAAAAASAVYLLRQHSGWPLARVGIMLLTALLPLAGSVLWAPAATARGYLVYGATLVLYLVTAMGFSQWRRASTSTTGRRMRTTLIVIVLFAHCAWNASYLWGEFGPLKAYFFGYGPAASSFGRGTTFLSLTGEEPTPAMLGGSATLEEAGLQTRSPTAATFPPNLFVGHSRPDARDDRLPTPPQQPVPVMRAVYGIAAKSFVAVCLLVLVLLGSGRRFRRAAVLCGVLLISTAWAAAMPLDKLLPLFVHNAYGFRFDPGAEVQYQIRVAPVIGRHLDELARPADRLYIVSPGAIGVGVRVKGVTDGAWQSAQQGVAVDLRSFRTSLESGETLSIALRALDDHPAYAACWQRQALRNRSLHTATGSVLVDVPCLPAVELRLVDQSGAVVFAGF